jgi:PBP1b-binding outer membrane lipoprotein LpoB
MEMYMNTLQKNIRLCLTVTLATAAMLIAGCSGMNNAKSSMNTAPLTLTGAQEVPPVQTMASGQSTVKIAEDKSVSGSITTNGIAPTMAHIHISKAIGTNGPVIVVLTKTADNVFIIPDGTKISDDQYAAYKAGLLYVNVHSAVYPGGEIRANLPPN